MLGALFFGYLVITGKYTVQFSEYRSIYNSVWFGTLMATTCATMFSIVGFYLVKNSIKRDRLTGVGQIIAATPLSNLEYILAKFVSNFLVLLAMVTVMAAMALVMLILHNESGTIDLWAFSVPFLLIATPAMMLVAAVAVFFETIRWLRGSFGNILYLFMAEMMLVMGMMRNNLLDLGGINLYTTSVNAAIQQAYPGAKVGMQMGFITMVEDLRTDASTTFLWNGIEWTQEALLFRFIWIGLALCVLVFALPFFDRFNPASVKRKKTRKKASAATVDMKAAASSRDSTIKYTQIDAPKTVFNFLSMFTAELRLMLRGYHWSWYLIAAGLMIAQWAAPFDIARMYMAPMSMVWPLLIWSSMGTREAHYHTWDLLFSSPMPLKRQLPALYLAGLSIAMISIGGMALRGLLAGEVYYSAALLTGALFTSSLALGFGTLSGSKKLFEVVYLMAWYIGSIDQVAALDLLGTTDAAITAAKLTTLILLSLGLLIMSIWARRRQVYG
jgi:hypothetical protein